MRSVFVLLLLQTFVVAAEPERFDVLVYGATPGGIAAALAAADDGDSVVLIEPTDRIGGLVTSGLSHTDFRTFEGITGSHLEFTQAVENYYRSKYGENSRQVQDCFRGTFAEPHVNLLVYQKLLASRKTIHLKQGLRLDHVTKTVDGSAIASAAFVGPQGLHWSATAAIFIDGSYEGDLMAKAGVKWAVGREGKNIYGENLAPEQSDEQLQAYNFRFIMTREPKNRVRPSAPTGYRRDDFLPVVEILKSGKIKTVFGYPSGAVFKAQTPPLPNNKYDINDVSRGLVRLSLPGKNLKWPDGTPEERAEVFAEHMRDQVGLLYFLQNDEAVPKLYRDETREWGFCRDEFADTNHLPPQLYVREARRMIGQHVFIEQDSAHAPGDARAVLHPTAIAMGDYGNNCHGTMHDGPRFGGKHTGELYKPVPPYQIPYGVLLPKELTNLLVPVAVSSSHIGFCALRLEPIWTSIGQAAGHAAHLAHTKKLPVQKVPVPELQSRLHQAGAATVYFSDVKPSDPDFEAAQWWGTVGGFHHIEKAPAKPGQRGKNLHGQYYEAYPGHAAKLNSVLTPELAQQWLTLAAKLGIPKKKLPACDGKITRRDWLRATFQVR